MEFSEEFYELIRQMRRWDNYSILDYAKKEAALAEKREIAKNLKIQGVDIKVIAKITRLSLEEVIAL